MKMKSIIIHSAAIVLLLVSIGFSAKAQENKTSIWGNRGGQYVGDEGMKSEEERLSESLITEEEAELLAKLFRSEEYEFPMDIRDNWHLGLHLGAMNSWGSYDDEAGWLKRTNFAAALSFGKYLHTIHRLCHRHRSDKVRHHQRPDNNHTNCVNRICESSWQYLA